MRCVFGLMARRDFVPFFVSWVGLEGFCFAWTRRREAVWVWENFPWRRGCASIAAMGYCSWRGVEGDLVWRWEGYFTPHAYAFVFFYGLEGNGVGFDGRLLCL